MGHVDVLRVAILGIIVSVAVFWLIILFSYLISSLFQYASFTRFYPWLIRHFGPYIGVFAVSTGVFTAASLYSKYMQTPCKCVSTIRLLGVTISLSGSAFLVCCSPLVYVLVTLFGGFVVWFAIYSKYLFVLASVIQFIGAAILMCRDMLKKLFIVEE